MSHMKRQVTSGTARFLKVENKAGETHYVRLRDTEIAVDLPNGNDFDSPELARTIAQYIEGEPEVWENIQGFGARLSAPGYLDCTPWDVFTTEAEALAYLDETYPEDEDDSE